MLLSNSGDIGGYSSLITILPDRDIGVYISLNTLDENSCARKAIHLYILDGLLGEKPSLDERSACLPIAPWSNEPCRTSNDSPSKGETNLELDAYTGQYHHLAYGEVEVVVENDHLLLNYGDGLKYRLISLGGNRFYGAPVALVMRGISDLHFKSLAYGIDTLEITSWEEDNPPTFVKLLGLPGKPASIKKCFLGSYQQDMLNNASICVRYSILQILPLLLSTACFFNIIRRQHL